MTYYILSGLLFFMAGCFDGFRDACIFHWDAVKRKLKLKTDYFNYLVSYLWKYKNHDSTQKETFIGKYFTFLVDGIHLLKTLQNLYTFSAVVLLFFSPNYTEPWKYILIGLAAWTINRFGFNATYRLFNLFK